MVKAASADIRDMGIVYNMSTTNSTGKTIVYPDSLAIDGA